MKNISIIGGGLIGSSWAAIFSKVVLMFLFMTHILKFLMVMKKSSLFLEELKAIDDKVDVDKCLNKISKNVRLEELC